MFPSHSRKAALFAVVAVLVLGAGIALLTRQPAELNNVPGADLKSEEAEIRAAVARFAEELKTVPLGAASDVLAKAIADNYGPLISADLLLAWQKEPEKAPGKIASLPVPEGITIQVLDRDPEDGSYTVEGDVVGGGGSQYQVAMKFRKQADGRWLITGFVGAIPAER